MRIPLLSTPASALLVLPILAGCDGGHDCTLIGCYDQLFVSLTADGAPVSTFAGTVTLAGVDYAVDCGSGGASDPAITCDDGGFTLALPDEAGGADLTYTLHGNEPGDSGDFGYDGSGTVTPDWTSSQPNGPDCGPTCWSGTVTIALDVLD